MSRHRVLALGTLLVSLAASGCGDASRPAPRVQRAALPADFVGVVAPEVLPAPESERRQALDAQHAAGIRLLRQTFDWSEIEPQRGTYDFSLYDGLVEASARAGVRVLPVLFRAPAFFSAAPRPGAKITATTTMPPRRPAEMADFARTLVGRYGPKGSFWTQHRDVPRVPIQSWQVWNEPNLPVYWGGRADAGEYVALLRAVGSAIRVADPRAEIVSAGIPESKLGVPLLTYVRELYTAGGKGTFDTLAVHPYARTVDAVLRAVRRVRATVVARADANARIWITEVGWASGGPGSSFTVTPGRQAQLAAGIVRQGAAEARALHLRGVVYYSWRDVLPYPGGKDFWGLHTGMVKRDNSVKPALTAFATAAKAAGAARR